VLGELRLKIVEEDSLGIGEERSSTVYDFVVESLCSLWKLGDCLPVGGKIWIIFPATFC
jgi:hypothetical protein